MMRTAIVRYHGWMPVTRLGAVLLVLALIVIGAVAPLRAQEINPEQVRAQLAEWTRLVDRFGREIGNLRLDEEDIRRLTERVNAVKADATALKDKVAGQASELHELLDSMKPPAEGATESPEAAAQRKELQERLGRVEGWQSQAEVVIARADQLIGRISAKRIELFARNLLRRGPSPLVPQTWIDAGREVHSLAVLTGTSFSTWVTRLSNGSDVRSAMFVVLVASALGLAGGFAARAYMVRRFGRRRTTEPAGERLGLLRASGATFIGNASPLVLAVLGAWATWPPPEFLPNAAVMFLVYGLVVGFVVLLLCHWAINASIEPTRPALRPLPIGDVEAVALARRLRAVIWVLAIHIAVNRATEPLSVVDNFTSVWNLLIVIAMALTLIRVLDRRLWMWALAPARPRADDGGGEAAVTAMRSDLIWGVLRYAALAAMWGAPLVAALGYANLAEYVSVGVIETGLVLYAASGAKLFARAAVEAAFEPERRLRRVVGRAFSEGSQGLQVTQFWLGLVLDFLILVAAALALLFVWGASREDIQGLGARLVEGVRIGPITVSITDVLLAMLVFTVVLGVTRYVQRVLDQRIFPGTHLDAGLRHSLRTSVGYVGLVIAFGLAIGTLGLNLSSVAIVAGALSVGIGFGLQNIVNNFVSGLILLIERPIKAGDWVEVGSTSGIVKRINVRSTELETFNRSTVLIPNSQLVSTAVTNWTHKDTSGRIDIPVTVAHVTDAEAVRAVLLECAAAHRLVMKRPPPKVILKDFNGTTFQFELQVTVPQAQQMSDVASDLRFAINQAFRAKGFGKPPS